MSNAPGSLGGAPSANRGLLLENDDVATALFSQMIRDAHPTIPAPMMTTSVALSIVISPILKE